VPVVVNLLHRCCHRSVSPAVIRLDVFTALQIVCSNRLQSV